MVETEVWIDAYGLIHPEYSNSVITNELKNKHNIKVKKDFEERILPWCKKNKLKLLIVDNDPKFHSKMITEFMKRNGVQICWGSGKKCLIT